MSGWTADRPLEGAPLFLPADTAIHQREVPK